MHATADSKRQSEADFLRSILLQEGLVDEATLLAIRRKFCALSKGD